MNKNQYLCSCCREPKTISYFYSGVGIQNETNLPICKDCCKKKLDRYTAVIGAEAGAWVLMAELGIPFLRDTWRTCLTTAKTNSTKNRGQTDPLSCYIKSLKECGTIYQGFWESDTMIEEIISQKAKTSMVKNNTNDLLAMNKKWGKYDDPEDYEFLEETLMDYTENLTNIDANLLNRYKDLCVAELAKRKAQERGDIGEISKAQDNVAKQLKLLKIDDFKQESTDEREKFIDRLCWMIEETEPAEEEDRKKYRDIAGFEEAFREIMRSMRNLIAGTKEYPDIPKEER